MLPTETLDAFRKGMVYNRAGGLVHTVSDEDFVLRFLILGTEKGTYYASGPQLTLESIQRLAGIALRKGSTLVDVIVDISESGRAPSNSPALLALALMLSIHPSHDVRAHAAACVPRVARTGSHLMEFLAYAAKLRGWGRLLKKATASWFLSRSARDLAYQAIKYQNRHGWSLRRALCNSHASTEDPERNDVLFWIANGWPSVGPDPHPESALQQIWAFETLKRLPDSQVQAAVRLIRDYQLPREAVPTRFLSHPETWEALFWHMPITALIRNLATLTRHGVLRPLSDTTAEAVRRLTRRYKTVHPVAIALAIGAYAAGGKDWTPIPAIIDALEEAFDLAFDAVIPSNKRILISIDVSGSMAWKAPNTSMSAAEIAAMIALTFARTEPNCHIIGMDTKVVHLGIGKTTSRREAMSVVRGVLGGGTDLSVPIAWALSNKLPADAFILLTDNETWANDIPVSRWMSERYRPNVNPEALLVACAMTATEYSITDPTDARSLSIVGFDVKVPNLATDFIRGFGNLPHTNEEEERNGDDDL